MVQTKISTSTNAEVYTDTNRNSLSEVGYLAMCHAYSWAELRYLYDRQSSDVGLVGSNAGRGSTCNMVHWHYYYGTIVLDCCLNQIED